MATVPNPSQVAITIQGMFDIGVGTAGSLDNAAQFLNSLNGREILTIASNTAQTVAAVTAVLGAFTIVGTGLVVGTALVAATITITKDLNATAPPGTIVPPINVGDVLSVLGNAASIAGAGLPGGSAVTLGFSIAGGTFGLGGILENGLAGGLAGIISPTLGTTPDPLVKTIRYVDPLILDLDGDGLEITPLSAGILFDANGDSIKTGTAWAGADDGMLVWDRNANGLIDSGAELFGDETLLANGQKAAHGFAALADLDKGTVVNGVTLGAGDGVFDAKDAQYAHLRVWRDVNQDGISQAAELKTLAETGVASITLGSTATSTNYGDAILARSGTFTRADGSAAQAGSFILAQNSFVRAFTPITVSAAATALPDLGGSGWVRDLQEAATLSPELIDLFNQAKDAPTRAGYVDAVAALLREWGNDSAYASASKQALGAGYGLVLSDPVDAQEAGWMDVAIKASEADRNAYRATLSATDIAKFDAMRERMVGGLEKIHAYEAFTGHTFLNWSQVQGDAMNYIIRTGGVGGGVPVEVWVPLSQIIFENRNAFMSSQAGYIRVNIPAPPSGMPHVETLWNRLVDDATNNLMPMLRLSKYIDMVDLTIDATGVALDFTRLNAELAIGLTANSHDGAMVIMDLQRVYGDMLGEMGWNGADQLRALMQRGVAEADIRSAFVEVGYGFFTAGAATGTEHDDFFVGDGAANNFTAGDGDDILEGKAGNDALNGGFGNDFLYGELGDDTLDGAAGNDSLSGGDGADYMNGGSGADTLVGGAGNDYLQGGLNVYGGGGLGDNDTLDGGAGNDTLMGGDGSDTYLFGRGDGQDTLNNNASLYGYADPNAAKRDVLQFKAGVLPADVSLTRSGDNLIVKINGTTDQVTVNNYFVGDGVSIQGYALEELRFADGTVWGLADIKAKVLVPTAGNDQITGYAGDDVLQGLGGNDTMYGKAGNDTLAGGDGNDAMYGEDGNDTLTGELGDDTLDGAAGNDSLSGGDGADYMNGGSGADTLVGGAGNDYLQGGLNVYGGGGLGDNDTLDGGAGNDTLMGGDGSDTYLFGRGDGQDTLNNNASLYGYADPNAAKRDVLQFKAGVLPADVSLTRSGDNLIVKINGTTDQVTVNNYFVGDGVSIQGYALEELRFADGTVWGLADIKAKVLVPTAGNDQITGYAGDDVLQGLGGNDTMYGKAGNDTLAGGDGNDAMYGEDGNDTLTGELGDDTLDGAAGNDSLSGGDGADYMNGGSGADTLVGGAGNDYLQGGLNVYGGGGLGDNDTLDGGAGNDTLMGGDGSDTYLFGRGDGQDTLNNNASLYGYADPNAAKRDVLQFKAGVLPADVSLTRSGDNLIVKINGTTDQVTVNNYFVGDGVSIQGYALEELRFADGTVWGLADIKAKVLVPTAGNDQITGYAGDDVLQGLGGNDTMYGKAGNDTLAGGDGNDAMYGEDGNDTLTGELGDDTLDGAAGNDSLSGGDGADYMNGGSGADTLVGGAGNDYLQGGLNVYGGGGLGDNDTLDGGAGNDTLMGGDGSDTYLFGRGDGQDTLNNNASLYGYADPNAAKRDVLQFKAGVLPADVSLTRSGDNLIVKINGTTDQVTVNNYFVGDGVSIQGYALEELRFADGTVWGLADIKAKVLVPTAGNDQITGYAGDDVLQGLGGNDTMYGKAGNDTLAGGDGNDAMYGEDGNDTLTGELGDDTLDGAAGNDSLSGGDGADYMNGGSGADTLVGGAGNDYLQGGLNVYGGGGLGDNDTLDGGAGNDTLMGGDGSDTYLFGRGDGQDTLNNNASLYGYADPNAAKRDVLQFKAGVLPADVSLTRSGDNLIVKINGTTDQVTVNNYFVGDGVSIQGYALEELRFADGTVWSYSTVKAKAGISVNGGAGNDSLAGSVGGDLIDGGAGADTMTGGLGDDVYLVDSTADVVNELAAQGVDTVVTTVTYTLAVNVENLMLTGATAINGTGNGLNNVLTGNSAANVLTGGAGDDTYLVGIGDTTVEVAGGGTDSVQSDLTWTLAAEVENLVLTGTAAINGTGNALNNTLIGNAATNYLNGLAGADTMLGGAGNDVYYVDNLGDTVTELLNEGTETIYSSVSYTLGVNQEHLVLNAATAINGTGNDLANAIYAGAGNNVIDGGLGADTATYTQASAGVVVSLALNTAQATGGSGSDTLLNIENLNGSSFNDTLIGNTGANLLNGYTGADTMVGGLGNDAYYIDNAGDSITELLNEGVDNVYFYLNQNTTLGEHLENLYLFGTGAVNGTGNALNNVVYAGAGNNVMDGGAGVDTVSYAYATSAVALSLAVAGAQATGGSASDTLIGFEHLNGSAYNDTLVGDATNNVLNGSTGADTMTGGLGNDSYYVDSVGDVVIELANEGSDLVYSSMGYTLGATVENLYLIGAVAVGATGNDVNNILYGHANTAANVLSGGLGNDTYYVSTGDSVVENLNAGTDTVVAYVNFALGANAENLTAGVTTDLQLTGNALNNVITGNAGKDGLGGGDGNDTLVGGAGADTLTGGLGADVFDFNLVTESGVGITARDLITDFLVGTDRIDLVNIDANVATAGDQAFAFIGAGAFTGAGQLRFSFDGTNTLVQGNIDAALGVDFEILLMGNHTLAAANFVL